MFSRDCSYLKRFDDQSPPIWFNTWSATQIWLAAALTIKEQVRGPFVMNSSAQLDALTIKPNCRVADPLRFPFHLALTGHLVVLARVEMWYWQVA